MSGTIKGGKKASKTLRKRYGKDFYRTIGAKGGRAKGVIKGFAYSKANGMTWHIEAGRKGGKVKKHETKQTYTVPAN